MKKIYKITFYRTIKAHTQVEAKSIEEAKKCFEKGEWIDFYETDEILFQKIDSVKIEE